jgi:hypothetical protein
LYVVRARVGCGRREPRGEFLLPPGAVG